jgi:NAD(P)-dependent dehydrogenase (short-subunit alcohol dehydrogenase family)
MSGWTAAEIPPLQGRVAIVTGATGGLGEKAAQELARAGAETILAGRNAIKGQAAVAAIRDKFPAAQVGFEAVDLADLASVAEFAQRYSSTHQSLDILINNAGVMALPRRQTTVDGFEMQFGTNFLGHFALTARLLPQLRAAAAPRIVNLSSIAHRTGTIDFGDLQGDRFYLPWKAYSQSKLAMLMFALELQRRSDATGWKLISLAAHPGWARTDLFTNGPGTGGFIGFGAMLAAPIFSQSAEHGALPILFAATSPGVEPGGYYGPNGIGELKGPPGPARIGPQAKNRATAARLWESSERLLGVHFA